MKQQKPSHSDIIIVGNGITSQFFALRLSKILGGRIRIIIIDKERKDSDLKEYVRALSLSLSTINLCKSLGIWKLIEPHTHPVSKIFISHSASNIEKQSFLNLDNRVNDEVASYIIDEKVLRKLVSEETAKLSNIDIIYANIGDIKLETDQVNLKVQNQILTSKLLVAADGRKSAVKKQLNIKSVSWDYNQLALSCLIEHSKNNENIAVENFLQTGPIALLPMGKGTSSVIWSMNRENIDQIKKISIGDLKLNIEKQFKNYIGEIIKLDNTGFFELNFSVVHKLYFKRCAIIGDAAHSIHPLAGQGTNLGLRDIICLSDRIIEAFKYGLDVGSTSNLQEYQRKRMPDILTSALAYDGINRLYSNNISGLNPLKNFVISLADSIPILKKTLVRGGSGISIKY